ncbi:MAG: ABC transporter substrate-binding protein [Nitrospinota bacterium]|nr:MAG: ABC transporter substrate-binding protein [Nitrospinota bacterium]
MQRFIIVLLSLTLLWTGGNALAATPKYGGTYRFPLSTDPPTLDPAQITDTTSHSVASEIFNALVRYDENLRLVPDIATRWEISPDKRTYTFYLRKGVKFHNGRECTAQDFRYTFERVLNPATHSPRTGFIDRLQGAKEYMQGKADRVTGITVVDDYTLKLTLEKPFTLFLHLLAYSSNYVVPREVVERYGKDFTSHPVGTGPFRFVEWKHDDHILLEANPEYFRGRPYLDRILYRIIPEEMTRLEEFKAGNLEHSDIPSGQFLSVKNDPELGKLLVSYPNLGTYSFRFNMEKPPFKNNKKLRQAFNYAIDRQAISDIILEGRVIPAKGVLPPTMPGYNPDLKGYTYNPEKARQLLAEAGYPGGKGFPHIDLYFNTNETHQKIAELVQAQLRELGINIGLRSLDWAAYIKLVDDGGTLLHRMGWIADYPDPENFLTVLHHSRNIGPAGNSARYSNPRVDALLDRADASEDWEERKRLYQEAERIIVDDAPWIYVYYYSANMLFQPYVRGLRLTGMDSELTIGIQPMELVWLDR